MTNWCYNTQAFYGDEKELEKLAADLKAATDFPSGSVGLSDIVSYYDDGELAEHLEGDGRVIDIEFDRGYLVMTSETAWGPDYLVDAFEAVLDNYEGVRYHLLAEEPGLGLMVNTDVDGDYFDYTCCLYNWEEGEMYRFPVEDFLLSAVYQMFGIDRCTLEEASTALEAAEAKGSVYEYETL